jgi:hypothetical protein
MVKGVTRRVVVIKSPDRDIFDEAIFIVREDLSGGSESDVVLQAQLAADSYIRDNIETRRLPRLPAAVYVAAGALLAGLGMLIYELIM